MVDEDENNPELENEEEGYTQQEEVIGVDEAENNDGFGDDSDYEEDEYTDIEFDDQTFDDDDLGSWFENDDQELIPLEDEGLGDNDEDLGDDVLGDDDRDAGDDGRDAGDDGRDDGDDGRDAGASGAGTPTPPLTGPNGEELITDVYGNVRGGDGKEQKPKSSKDRYIPDDIKEVSNVKDANNIMDLFWQQCCVATFDWVANKTIKLAFKICDLALSDLDADEIDTGNKDYFSINDGVFNKVDKELKGKRDEHLQQYSEFEKNIARVLNGEPEEWTNGVSRPDHFDGFVDIARKAKADENSDEAKLWAQIEKTPDVINAAYEKECAIARKSLTIATLEVMSGERKPVISKDLDKGLDELITNVEAYRRECSGEDRKDILADVNEWLEEQAKSSSGGTLTGGLIEDLQKDLSDPTQTNTRDIINRHLGNIINSAQREGLDGELMPLMEKMDNYVSTPEVTEQTLQDQITTLKGLAPANEEVGLATKDLLNSIGEYIADTKGEFKGRHVSKVENKVEKIRALPKENDKYIAQAILEGGMEHSENIMNHMNSILSNSRDNQEGLAAIEVYDAKVTKDIDIACKNMRNHIRLNSEKRKEDVKNVLASKENEPIEQSANQRNVRGVTLSDTTLSMIMASGGRA